jgi:hypothetical protein
MKVYPSPCHLTYCTNIHPGETWPEVFRNLQTYSIVLKQRISPDQPFGLGLRLSNAAAQTLLQGQALAEFKDWLTFQGLYIFTLNGFSYGGFHHQVVKDRVYAPDWTSGNRTNYTLQLVHILAELLPEAIEGGISTLPLSYKPWHLKKTVRKTAQNIEYVFRQSSRQIAQVVAEMAYIAQSTGKRMHLDLEPEPDGLLENVAEVITFFEQWLRPVGSFWLAQQGFSPQQTESLISDHVQVCYDTCHFAVEYAKPDVAISQLQIAGIRIGKLQLSSALQVPIPISPAKRQCLYTQLQPFAESTYLHQVIERRSDGSYYHYPDLIEALPHLSNVSNVDGIWAHEWRIHFHIPIFLKKYHKLSTTQDHITGLLQILSNNLPLGLECQHLEIETYTWEVMPAGVMDILSSIQREYEWVLKTLQASQKQIETAEQSL